MGFIREQFPASEVGPDNQLLARESLESLIVSPPDGILVATAEDVERGNIIGTAAAILDGRDAYVADVAVDAKHRGNGVGERVLRALGGVLGEGVRMVGNPLESARGFYERLGAAEDVDGEGMTFRIDRDTRFA